MDSMRTRKCIEQLSKFLYKSCLERIRFFQCGWPLENCSYAQDDIQSEISTYKMYLSICICVCIDLHRCHIQAENLTIIELQELEAISVLYEDMIKERELDFDFTANEVPHYM